MPWNKQSKQDTNKLFRGKDSTLDRAGRGMLDNAASYLQQHGKLRLELLGKAGLNPQDDATTQARIAAVKDYLSSSHSPIAGDRIVLKQDSKSANVWLVNLRLIE